MKSIQNFIVRNKDTYEKVSEVPKELIAKYETILPQELIYIWKTMGLGIYEDGYLQIINPEEWDFVFQYIDKILEPSVVIGITALGDLLVWEGNDNWTIAPDEGNRLAFFNLRSMSKKIQGELHYYLKFRVKMTSFLEEEYNAKPYLQMKDKLPKLAYGQCYGYVPALPLGGKQSNKNLKVVDAKAYINLIGEAVGKIYGLED